MLVLRRRLGQWTYIIDPHTGLSAKFKVYKNDLCGEQDVCVAFDDPEHNFQFERAERLFPDGEPPALVDPAPMPVHDTPPVRIAA